MSALDERVTSALDATPGLTDRELTDLLVGAGEPQQSINQVCRRMAELGLVERRKRVDGKIGNYASAVGGGPSISQLRPEPSSEDPLSEDRLKDALKQYLEAFGWTVTVAWGHERGIDVDAVRGDEHWIIEVKGSGSSQPMRVNYFIGMLGETLQRMVDPNARYSIAMPELKQFRGLWSRLPLLAKSRTKISALFVDADGRVVEA